MNRQKPYTLYVMLVLAALWIAFFLMRSLYSTISILKRRISRTAYKILVVPIY